MSKIYKEEHKLYASPFFFFIQQIPLLFENVQFVCRHLLANNVVLWENVRPNIKILKTILKQEAFLTLGP